MPESEGWDPVPGSTGRQAAESLGEDEDAEGRSEAAQMYEEGIDEAEHDQCAAQRRRMSKATKNNSRESTATNRGMSVFPCHLLSHKGKDMIAKILFP